MNQMHEAVIRERVEPVAQSILGFKFDVNKWLEANPRIATELEETNTEASAVAVLRKHLGSNLERLRERTINVNVYLVIELENHTAYPFGKEDLEERARKLAAEGKLPTRWVDPAAVSPDSTPPPSPPR